MSLVEKICEELGVEVGEEWLGNDETKYRISQTGEIFIYDKEGLYTGVRGFSTWESIFNGELKPVWQPKHGTAYYIPDIFVKGLCLTERWDGLDIDYMYLKRGLVFKTEEEAIEMSYKIIEFIKEKRENE